MIRLLAHPISAVMISDLVRCTYGVLGITVVAGAISIGAVPQADAAVSTEPEPRRSIPPVCQRAIATGDRQTVHKCKEAWLAMMFERSRKRSARGREFPGWMNRLERKPKIADRPSRPGQLTDLPSSPPTPNSTGGVPSPSPRSEVMTPRAPAPPATHAHRAGEIDSRPSSLQPVLLLGLLLPAAAAICYPFRHRLYAAAGWPAPVTTTTAAAPPAVTYRSVLDPFAAPATGLRGPGAAAAARRLALTALDDHGDSSLVVLPRPDATVLFGLDEDELLDDDSAGLFIPGNLDAALAYLETELAIRTNTGVTNGRRLLLVADCGTEAERIKALLARHPGAVSAVLLGAWTGDRITIDDDGLVDAPKTLATTIPRRLPAVSRTEARDRLLAALAQQKQNQKPTSKRRSASRRS